MTIGEVIFIWAVFAIVSLVALHKEAKKERRKWRRRYNMRRGIYNK